MTMESKVTSRSAVEGVKEESRYLRGTIALELVEDTSHFNEQDKHLIKFHGTYQQDDRDARKHRDPSSPGKQYMFMVRCKIPAGWLTARQYLAIDDIAGNYANGTLRFTSRQGIQLHGVLKGDLKATIADINACLLTTLGACGDVNRNVMACPAPHPEGSVHAALQEMAAVLAKRLAPRTEAYHEIWLDGEPVNTASESADATDQEPLYGKTYLPRKFKIGLCLPEDNCIDIYTQDLGFLAITEQGDLVGYNVLAGGGMGMTHGNTTTFPQLAKPIGFISPRAVVEVAEAVLQLFRDHGNRADRKRARLKYLIHDWGVEKFRQVLSEYLGTNLQPPRPINVHDVDTHLGWQAQGDGKFFYGISVASGRVKDEGSLRLRTGLRAIIERFLPELRLTPLQDILLCNLEASDRPKIEQMLDEYGIPRPNRLTPLQQYSLACPAIPTCSLALSESERVMPEILNLLRDELKQLGLENELLTVRMTGCPSGCARPYQSDIGIVGRSGDKYTLFVGGNRQGTRLNFILRDLVPIKDIVPTLLPLLQRYKAERNAREGFGDYCQRLGVEHLQTLLPVL